MKPDLKQAVMQAAPTTKAAQLREVMPEIEMKLAAGTPLAAIHQALTHSGLDLTLKTLKTYLHRYRKKQRCKSVNQPHRLLAQPARYCSLHRLKQTRHADMAHRVHVAPAHRRRSSCTRFLTCGISIFI